MGDDTLDKKKKSVMWVQRNQSNVTGTSDCMRGKSEKASVNCSVVCNCNPVDYSLPGSSVHGDSPGKDTAVGNHSLLQGISLTQDGTQVSCTTGRFFPVWATRKTPGVEGVEEIWKDNI